MANNYQISATQLTPGATVVISGTTTFSRLSKLVDGPALALSDAQRVKNGMQPVGVPHTSINIAGAEVAFADPANPTLEERFVDERRFLSKAHPEQGLSYGIDNKSSNLPIVGVRNAQGQVEQVVLQGDLAADLKVSLVLRVYKPKNYANCGLSLDYVVVEEPIRYYNGGVDNDALAARGIIFAAPPVRVDASAAAQAAAPAAGAYTNGLPAGTDPNTGLPAPAVAMPAVAATPPVMQQAAPAVASPVAQAAPALTAEQELAQLKAQIAAQNASGGASAFTAPAADPGPWDTTAQTAAPQGIAYSG